MLKTLYNPISLITRMQRFRSLSALLAHYFLQQGAKCNVLNCINNTQLVGNVLYF